MKKETLEETLKCLFHLSNSVGEVITEYHWRDFCGLILMLKENFPEYNLEQFEKSLYERLDI